MNENPYAPPCSPCAEFQPLRWLARLSLFVIYPFLLLSLIFVGGLSFGSAFVVDFVVQNDTNQPIEVTPVGTVGQHGRRSPLPVKIRQFPAFPASKCGGFRLEPGESVTILYDMDDINFSEIVVRDANGIDRQLVVNPNPTMNQYRAPSQSRFAIHDVATLDSVPAPILAASIEARTPSSIPWIFASVMFLPWPIYIGLLYFNRRLLRADSKVACKHAE